MKRTILLISMMLSSFICSAQTMLEEGNEWVYCHAGYSQRAADKPLCSLSFNKYFLNGTRTIEGREYHEIWVQCYDIYAHRQEGSEPDAYFHVDTLNQIHEPGYFLSLREECGRVFANVTEVNTLLALPLDAISTPIDGLFPSEGNEYVIYNFNDTSGTINFYTGKAIPFVGGLSHLIIDPFIIYAPDGTSWRSWLNLFSRNGAIEYISPDFIHDPFFPDFTPTSINSPTQKSVNRKSVNCKWSDLSGRHLPSLPTQKGIYIKDGRKVLIK